MNALSGYKTRTIAGALTASALFLIAVGIKFLSNYDVIDFGRFYGVIRNACYFVFFLMWGVSLHRRILNKYTRRCLEAVAVSELFWILVKMLKYDVFRDELSQLYLWYMFYIPMLLMPLFAMLCAVSIGRPESLGWNKKTIVPVIVTVLLIAFVLTNNSHELVFSFPGGASVRSEMDRDLEFGIYIVTAWQIICAFAALGIIVSKARFPGHKKVVILPAIPIILLLVYSAVYSVFIGPVFPFEDLNIVESLLVTASLELCVATRLIMSNSGYPELFFASEINAEIIYDNGEVYAATAYAPIVDEELLARFDNGEDVIIGGTRLASAPIKGGRVVWEEDISEVIALSDHLKDLSEELQNRDEILKAQYESRHKLSVLEEKNRLYDRMTSGTRDRLDSLRSSAEAFRNAKTEAEEKTALRDCMLLLSYLKRRNNLILLSENELTVNAHELELCFKETCATIESFGVSCSVVCLNDASIPVIDAATIYDRFEDLVENSLDGLSVLSVVIRDEVAVRLQTSADLSVLESEGVSAEAEDEDEWIVTIRPEASK